MDHPEGLIEAGEFRLAFGAAFKVPSHLQLFSRTQFILPQAGKPFANLFTF
jgi:hypothetical protein